MGYKDHRITSFLCRKENLPYVFLAPALVTLVIIAVFPFLYILWISLRDFYLLYPDSSKFIGLANYKKLFFGDPGFWNSLRATLYFSGVAIAVEFVLSLVLALLLNRESPERNAIRTLLILPMVATPIAVSYMWRIMYNPSIGILNYFLSYLNIRPLTWVADPRLAMPSLIIVDIWQWTPFMTLIMVAGLMSLPSEPFEAALVDGASWWQSFRYITVPLLKPIFFIALLLRTIDSLKTFDIIYALTGGGPIRVTETLNIFIYQNAFRFLQIGYAGAASIILLFIITFICMVLVRWSGIEMLNS